MAKSKRAKLEPEVEVVYALTRGPGGWVLKRGTVEVDSLNVVEQRGPHDISTALAMLETWVMRRAQGGSAL